MILLKHVAIYSIILITLAFSSGHSQQTNTKQANNPGKEFTRIDAFLSELSQRGFNGAVLVAHGKDIFKKGYGFSDKENQTPCTPQTVFDIGSVTKQFTGAAILKLEMQGKLSVNDRITKYFDNVPADKQSITIHQLLTHSGGFSQSLGDDYTPLTKADFINDALQSKLLFTPGGQYEYSNVGYSLLAAIIEKTSEMTYEQYLNRNLFKPAGMNNTGYKLPNWNETDIAAGYNSDIRWGKPNEKPWGDSGPYWNLLGNGGILSTVEDLYKWHVALLGDRILDRAAKEKYYKRYIEEGPGAGSYYGYGWAIFPTPRNTWLITHNGGNGMFFCDFLRYLDEDVTIIVLCNSYRQEFRNIAREIALSIFNPGHKPYMDIQDKKFTSLEQHPDKELIKKFVDAIFSGDNNKIEQMVRGSFSKKMINFVPMEKHIEMLSRLKQDLSSGEISGVYQTDDKTEIKFSNSSSTLTLVIQNGKIDGVMIGN
jgi:CubicO group peptidase (beta-lactamase class C family)